MLERMRVIFKRYPLSFTVLITIVYLSFFKPPKTLFDDVNNFDKLVHFVMYFGFCLILWLEYFLTHTKISTAKIIWGAIFAPIAFSGFVELGQEYLTAHRGGDWLDFFFNSLGVVGATLFSVCVTRPVVAKYNLWNKRNKN